MIGTILSWLTGGTLKRILDTVDHKVDNETERERIKTHAVETYVEAQARILTGRGWWFPLFFIAPLGFWFASVCIYSVFFCARCAFPQPWSIAALPSPLDEWAGVIIGSLFLARYGESLLARLKK
ncbi:hypothetical protein HTY61_05035 [Oricola thermophila]|uniref:Holin of 3TMs, for gene-transfer release n=1 Tax=Oricola thermophila TaxID=2742145 RepID=A0A6N1VB26_9HYPH|nr:hypothetical protein HTY61_05035 [Oricola thermophila]